MSATAIPFDPQHFLALAQRYSSALRASPVCGDQALREAHQVLSAYVRQFLPAGHPFITTHDMMATALSKSLEASLPGEPDPAAGLRATIEAVILLMAQAMPVRPSQAQPAFGQECPREGARFFDPFKRQQ